MSSGVAQAILTRIGPTVISGVFLSLLVTAGLLTAPVICMCDVGAANNHALFPLPSHRHIGADQVSGHSSESAAAALTERDVSPLAAPDDKCDDPESRMRVSPDGYGYVTLGTETERQDGAVLQAPGSPPVGHLTAITQPAPAPDGQHGSLIPFTDRALEGLEPAPETPPPRTITI